jgi:glutaredoxin-like YruB-family protein
MSKKVIVFSTPTCGWCRKVKEFLREKNIQFQEIDVSQDPKAAADMIRKSGQQGVPQIWIDNVPVVGFDKEKIIKLIQK